MNRIYRDALLALHVSDSGIRIATGEYAPPIVGCQPGVIDYGYPPCMLSLLYEPGPSHLAAYLSWDDVSPEIVLYYDETSSCHLVGVGADAFTWRVVENVLRLDDEMTDRVRSVGGDLGVSESDLTAIERHACDHDELSDLSDILPSGTPRKVPSDRQFSGSAKDEHMRIAAFGKRLAAGDAQGAWHTLEQGGWSFGSARAAVRDLLASGHVPKHMVHALQHWLSLIRPDDHVAY